MVNFFLIIKIYNCYRKLGKSREIKLETKINSSSLAQKQALFTFHSLIKQIFKGLLLNTEGMFLKNRLLFLVTLY